MSSGAPRPLGEMAALAAEVVALLAPACERCVVAGSIRRRVPEVGDLELVCVPTLVAYRDGLFGDVERIDDRLGARVAELVAAGVLAPRPQGERAAANGSRYRSLLYRGAPLDLFSPDADAFAVVLAIRTGPASFSRRLVTPRTKGGLMPDFMHVKGGRLWAGERAVPCAEEADVFRALGLPVIPPERRTGTERVPTTT